MRKKGYCVPKTKALRPTLISRKYRQLWADRSHFSNHSDCHNGVSSYVIEQVAPDRFAVDGFAPTHFDVFMRSLHTGRGSRG